MDAVIAFLNDNLTWVLIFFLIAAGIAFTVMTRGVQFRLFGTMWKVIFNSRAHVSGGISSFQAFDLFQVMTLGGPDNQTRVLSLDIYENAFRFQAMGWAAAQALVLLAIVLLITLVQSRMLRTRWSY